MDENITGQPPLGYVNGFSPIRVIPPSFTYVPYIWFNRLQNLFQIIPKAITMTGFTLTLLRSKWESAFQDFVIPHLASGMLKYSQEVHWGLDKVGDTFLALQKGQNKAKVVIVVADK